MRLRRPRRPPVLSSQNAYARWAKNYPPQPHNVLMEVEQDAMLSLLPPLQNRFVLDLACGTGRWGKIAATHGAHPVIGFDHSHEMLKAGILTNIAQAEMTVLPLPDSIVDVILCGLAIGHLQPHHLPQALHEIARVLRPKACALISDFHPFLAWNNQQRTFRDEKGRLFAVQHDIHRYSDIHGAALAAGLLIDAVREPSISSHTPPLVIVYRLIKSG